MRAKFTYVEGPAQIGALGMLQDDVAQFFASIKSRIKTTAAEGEALFERSLPELSAMAPGDLPADKAYRYMETRNVPRATRTVRDVTHATLHSYEQRHLTASMGAVTVPTLDARQSLFKEFRTRFAYRGVRVAMQATEDVYSIYVDPSDGPLVDLGTLYFADSRFVLLGAQPAGALSPVYVDRENPGGRHYIKLATTDTFVRRFAVRGLNGFDTMQLDVGGPLRAPLNEITPPGGAINPAVAQGNEVGGSRHRLASGAPMSTEEKLLSHTRGWGKRFVSAGVTNHGVYSTRGTRFQSLFGAVTIDLAKVPPARIFDLHSAETAGRWIGHSVLRILTEAHHTGNNDYDEEQYLALRDVVRTRELVIQGEVPNSAIVARRQEKTILAIGSLGNTHQAIQAWTPPVTVVANETLTFVDPNSGRRWRFIKFASQAHAQAALNTVPAAPAKPRDTRLVSEYSPIHPQGMV